MADIPSLGINVLDVYDPNLINVEAQAYPRPLDPAQALTQQLAALLNASLFAPPRVLDPPQNNPIPAAVPVQQQTYILPSLSQGAADPTETNVDVGAQVVTRQPVAEFLVTQEGNFRTDATASTVRYKILSVSTLSQYATAYSIVLQNTSDSVVPPVTTVNLFTLGIDLTGLEVRFPGSAPGLDPQDVPTGPITFYGKNFIIVDGADLSGDPPVAGDLIDIPTQRVGPSDIVGLLGLAPANVVIAPNPPVATTVASASNPTINVRVDNTLNPIITGGTRIPLLLFQNLPIPGAFEVEFATPLSRGLPANVFV